MPPFMYAVIGAGVLGGLIVAYEVVVPWLRLRLGQFYARRLHQRRLDDLRVCCRGCTAK